MLNAGSSQRYGDAGGDASGVSAEALKLTRAEPLGNEFGRRQPYGSLNDSHHDAAIIADAAH